MKRRVAHFGVSVLALVLLATACAQSAEPATKEAGEKPSSGFSKNADGYIDITSKQLTSMLSNKDFTLVNVHIPYAGDIPQTDLSIPFDQVADNVNQLPDMDAAIVVYCRSGSMSTQAAKTLTGLGYTNVMELDGGFNAWKAAGYSMAGE